MTQPFKCSTCGSNDYVIVLTGCNIKGATVEERYAWDQEASEYIFGGSMVVESESVENEAAHAVCANCEADVTEAVTAYEQSQPGSGNGEAQA
jgi:poly(3-hydroxybutyrate) depolymerase